MTQITFNDAQMDAVCDAQDEEADTLGRLTPIEVAEELARRGHPEFAGWGQPAAEPEAPKAEAEPELTPEQKRAARRERLKAQLQQTAEDSGPELDTGAPGDVAVVTQAEAEQAKQAPQLPAKREPSGRLPLARPATHAPSLSIPGMEGLDQSDLAMPTLKLKQAQTETQDDPAIAQVPDGDWFLSTDPGGHGKRELVFLEIRKGRSFLLPYRQDERDDALLDLGLDGVVPAEVNVLCSSLDRVTPEVREDRDWPTFNPTCEGCPHSEWRTTASGARRPPACGENYRALVVDVTEGGETPARLLLRSTGIKPTKKLLVNLGMGVKRYRVPGIFGLVVELGSVKSSGKDSYYIPEFGRPKPVEPELVEHYAALRESLVEGDALDRAEPEAE